MGVVVCNGSGTRIASQQPRLLTCVHMCHVLIIYLVQCTAKQSTALIGSTMKVYNNTSSHLSTLSFCDTGPSSVRGARQQLPQ